jgi:N-acetylglutamate synthase-like GNAT family acetyltransferase
VAELTIEPYRVDFQDEILELIVNIQRKEFGISITAEDQPDLTEIPDFYQTGDGNFWVAAIGRKVVGTISIKDIGQKTCALRKMFVHADYRGSKHQVAMRLLETLIRWCRQRSVKTIYLGTTSRYLAAHRFYEKNGFVEIPKERLPGSFPVMKVDTKFYHYRVKDVETDP